MTITHPVRSIILTHLVHITFEDVKETLYPRQNILQFPPSLRRPLCTISFIQAQYSSSSDSLITYPFEMSAPPIEPIELPENDADSGYDEEQISTASVTSSILAYQEENGRTYHAYKAGKYVMPNDEGEQERMDRKPPLLPLFIQVNGFSVHYHATRMTLDNKHWIAPIDDPRAIIDIGTGTGIWAMDVADDFPGSTVLGTDLSPIQPTLVPPNLEFVVQDLQEPWDMPGRFDLVHTRYMNGIAIQNWLMLYRHAFEACKPGAWVENQEVDGKFKSDDNTLKPDSAIIRWQNLMERGLTTIGQTGRCNAFKMADNMRDAGFINVVVQEVKAPIGPWPKDKRLREAGVYGLVGLIDGLAGLSLRVFTQILGWSVNEMEALLMQARAEWRRKSVHSYLPM
jgi:hypothetical protein